MKLALSILMAIGVFGAEPIKPAKTPPDPAFNRLYPNAEIEKFLKAYAEAYPDWVKLEAIGKGGGRRHDLGADHYEPQNRRAWR